MRSQNCKSPFRKALNILTLLFITTIHISFAQDVELGESLFSSNCASCHYLGPETKKLVGPGLNDHIFEEYTTEWLYSWIKNSSELRSTFAYLPIKKIIVETDSPFLAPIPMRGKKNEPSFIKYTLEKLAEIKEISFNDMDKITSENFHKLFSLK